MGFGGISIWQLLIILAIIVLLFGTKKLRNIGSDLGNAVRGFKKAVNSDNESDNPQENSVKDSHNEPFKVEGNGKTTPAKDTEKMTAEKSQLFDK